MTHSAIRTRQAPEADHHPGELTKPALCLFVITPFTGIIRQALPLVLSQIPAPGAAGQAPLTAWRASPPPSPHQNTCPPFGFWGLNAVGRQVRCFVQPHLATAHMHPSAPALFHTRLHSCPKTLLVVSDLRFAYKQKCALINRRKVLSWEPKE